MPAIEPLYNLIGINTKNFSKEEKILLEAELFLRFYEELKETFRQRYKTFFQIFNFTLAKENSMLDKNLIKIILNDILSTDDYTIQGIARYTDTPEEIIHELASGLNTKPSAICLRKVIELHRSVRRDLYQAISKKIIDEYKEVA